MEQIFSNPEITYIHRSATGVVSGSMRHLEDVDSAYCPDYPAQIDANYVHGSFLLVAWLLIMGQIVYSSP